MLSLPLASMPYLEIRIGLVRMLGEVEPLEFIFFTDAQVDSKRDDSEYEIGDKKGPDKGNDRSEQLYEYITHPEHLPGLE